MILRLLLAALHFLALGIGFGAIVERSAALRGGLDRVGIARVLRADTAWGIAAVIWISTGLLRAFGGFEKGTAYYIGSAAFLHKMTLLGAVLVLEVWPMVTFIRWRISLRKGSPPDTARALLLSWVSVLQAVLIVFMVILATAMARGYWS